MKVLIGFPKMGVEIPSTPQSHLLWAIAICYIEGTGGRSPEAETLLARWQDSNGDRNECKKRIKTNKIETTLDISDYDGFGPLHPAFGV